LVTEGSAFKEAVGNLALIAFYYLLCIGERTVKGTQNETKQTQQFKLGDVRFFKRDKLGQLCQLPCNAPNFLTMSTNNATLSNLIIKNGWHGICISHEWNGNDIFDGV
jgi:hypothetical protein